MLGQSYPVGQYPPNQNACAAEAPEVGRIDVYGARRRHDVARNRFASSAEAVRKAREVLTHLESDACRAEYELREANEELLRALRQG